MKDTGARLTRDTVLRAALELLDEVGIDGLSTRRLAERLGVQSPTLYWHFRNKAELLDAMAEAIMLERHGASLPQPDDVWDAWLAENARSFRRALLAYRDGARLHAGTRPRALHFSSIERKVALLGDAGFTPDEAVDVMVAISRFVVGWVLEEQAGPGAGADAPLPDAAEYPLLAKGWAALRERSDDEAFERGIAWIVDGARARLAVRRAG
ncbi:tetracycline resistance transcriptional repressor TetR [Burkholderia sp. AU42008]|uniref:tetracycline resistance transcriptional repressor TetR n=1 Tax=unclassified Burkholderia TaxID=2613784 RepID=UPI000B7A94B9|nr:MULTISPECIES: tetracycline resistance transcriptional repressor TetR [unclassified Burkholderia]RQU21791.1 TetR family transcriptional regulator [Burkholderia cenocepacia]MBR8234106.1 tetracycline resistance transcriptional repressor TetR [Burkholderia sp. AU32357]MBY4872487.1 tetracycline resistance transcriptional repressor TetR [Burkholderia sp. AU42008]OXI44193.1 TetR family transcriptional regulator [Burkholderia sp. AU17457]OXI72462.1 TetR family transcriptional regulator [Burkholderi